MVLGVCVYAERIKRKLSLLLAKNLENIKHNLKDRLSIVRSYLLETQDALTFPNRQYKIDKMDRIRTE